MTEKVRQSRKRSALTIAGGFVLLAVVLLSIPAVRGGLRLTWLYFANVRTRQAPRRPWTDLNLEPDSRLPSCHLDSSGGGAGEGERVRLEVRRGSKLLSVELTLRRRA